MLMSLQKCLKTCRKKIFSSKNAMDNAERKVFQTVSSANTVDCYRLRGKPRKALENKASFRIKTFCRMTMAAMLGRRRR